MSPSQTPRGSYRRNADSSLTAPENEPDRAPIMLNTAGVALLLGIAKQTARLHRAKGTGPRFCKVGTFQRGRCLYRREDVLDWIAAHSYANNAESRSALEHPRTDKRRRRTAEAGR